MNNLAQGLVSDMTLLDHGQTTIFTCIWHIIWWNLQSTAYENGGVVKCKIDKSDMLIASRKLQEK